MIFNFQNLSYPRLNMENSAQSKKRPTSTLIQSSSKKKRIAAVASATSVVSTGEDFEDNDERDVRKEAEAAETMKKKRGKAADWETKFEFTNEEYHASDVAKKLKLGFAKHRTRNTKTGLVTEFWCKYGKKIGFSCPVKVKVIKNEEKTTVMEEKDPKDHDHEEKEEGDRVYGDYNPDQTKEMKECLKLDMSTRNIKKSLQNKGLFTDENMPGQNSFYHKINQLKKELKLDQVKITVDDFKGQIQQNSAVPENEDEAYIVKAYVEESDGVGDLKFHILISTPRLIQKNLVQQSNEWCLCADATYQTNMENAPVILFGANTYDTGNKFVGIGAVVFSNEEKATYDFLLKFVK